MIKSWPYAPWTFPSSPKFSFLYGFNVNMNQKEVCQDHTYFFWPHHIDRDIIMNKWYDMFLFPYITTTTFFIKSQLSWRWET